jgi:hypothetical protein
MLRKHYSGDREAIAGHHAGELAQLVEIEATACGEVFDVIEITPDPELGYHLHIEYKSDEEDV